MSIEIPIDLIMGEDSATPTIISAIKTMQQRFQSLSNTIAVAARAYQRMGSTDADKLIKTINNTTTQFSTQARKIRESSRAVEKQRDVYLMMGKAADQAVNYMKNFENQVVQAAGGYENITAEQLNAISRMREKYNDLGKAVTDLGSTYQAQATALDQDITAHENKLKQLQAEKLIYESMPDAIKKMNDELKARGLRQTGSAAVMGMTQKNLSPASTGMQQLDFFKQQADSMTLVVDKIKQQYEFELKILKALDVQGDQQENIDKLKESYIKKLEHAHSVLNTINRVSKNIEKNVSVEERLTHKWNEAVSKVRMGFQRVGRKVDEIVRHLRRAGRTARNFGRNLQFTARDILFTVGALGSFAVLGVKSFADLQREAAQLGISMGHVSDAIEAGMMQIRTGFATTKAFGASMQQTAEMLTLIEQAGFKGADSLMVLEQSMKLAKATFSDAETAVDAITDVLIAFRVSLPEDPLLATTRAMDVLTLASLRSKATLGEMRTSMQYVSGVAEAYGFSLEEVAAAMATLTNAGIPASVGSRRLASVFDSLATKGQDYIRDFLDPATGQLRPLSEQLDVLQKQYDAWGNELDRAGFLSELFGSRQAELVKRLLDNRDAFSELVAEMENANGITEELSSKTGERLDLQLKELINTLDAMKIAMGEAIGTQLMESGILKELITTFESLEPFFRELGRGIGLGLTTFLERANGLLKSIAGAANNAADGFEGMAGAGSAVARLLIDLLDRVGVRIGFINSFLKKLGEMLDKLFGTAGTTSLESIASAFTQIALLGVALVPILAGLGLIVETVGVAVSLFTPVLSAAVATLKLLSAGTNLAVSGAQAGAGIAGTVGHILSGIAGAVVTLLSTTLVPGIVSAIEMGFASLSGWWTAATASTGGIGIGGLNYSAAGTAATGGGGALGAIGGALSSLAVAMVALATVLGIVVGFFEMISKLLTDVGDGLKPLFDIFDGLMSVLKPLIDLVGGILHLLFQFGRLIGVIIALFAGGIIKVVIDLVKGLLDFLTSFQIVNDFLQIVSNVLQWFIDMFWTLGDAIQTFVDMLLADPMGVIDALIHAIVTDGPRVIIEGITAMFDAVVQPVLEFVDSILGTRFSKKRQEEHKARQEQWTAITTPSGERVPGRGSTTPPAGAEIGDQFWKWMMSRHGKEAKVRVAQYAAMGWDKKRMLMEPLLGNLLRWMTPDELAYFFQLQGVFKRGGNVPGPIGTPRPVLAHGDEGIFTPEQQDMLKTAQDIIKAGAAGVSITNNWTLIAEDPMAAKRVMKTIEDQMRMYSAQPGV